MQASIHRFDPGTAQGSVLTDDGLVLPFDAQAFADSGLRHLRPGQRLDVTLDGAADAPGTRVRSLRLGTVGRADRELREALARAQADAEAAEDR